MGSPLGPILADIFMASLEHKTEADIREATLYRRYVDDILLITGSVEQSNGLFEVLNNAHPNIKLSIEYESENCLSFLDVKICRRPDGTISRSVHRKGTWTGQYLHFSSFVPVQHKRGLVRTLFDRASKIRTEDTIDTELTT